MRKLSKVVDLFYSLPFFPFLNGVKVQKPQWMLSSGAFNSEEASHLLLCLLLSTTAPVSFLNAGRDQG